MVSAMSTAELDAITAVDLGDLAGSWYIALEAEGKSRATLKAYRAGVAGFLAWHAAQFPDAVPVLDRPAAAAYLADLRRAGQSPGTMRLRFGALRLFSAWLAEEGETSGDPLRSMKPPKGDKPVVPALSDAELDALTRACRGTGFAARRDEALVRLMAATGLRAGEVCDLRVSDVDLRGKTLVVRRGKGGKGRRIGIGPQAARALDRYLRARRAHRLAATDALWLGEMGRSFGYQGLARALGLRAKAAGIDRFHPHRLRHSFASRWLAAGGSEDGLMATAGWTSRDMISRYTSDTAQSRAIEEAARLALDDF